MRLSENTGPVKTRSLSCDPLFEDNMSRLWSLHMDMCCHFKPLEKIGSSGCEQNILQYLCEMDAFHTIRP